MIKKIITSLARLKLSIKDLFDADMRHMNRKARGMRKSIRREQAR